MGHAGANEGRDVGTAIFEDAQNTEGDTKAPSSAPLDPPTAAAHCNRSTGDAVVILFLECLHLAQESEDFLDPLLSSLKNFLTSPCEDGLLSLRFAVYSLESACSLEAKFAEATNQTLSSDAKINFLGGAASWGMVTSSRFLPYIEEALRQTDSTALRTVAAVCCSVWVKLFGTARPPGFEHCESADWPLTISQRLVAALADVEGAASAAVCSASLVQALAAVGEEVAATPTAKTSTHILSTITKSLSETRSLWTVMPELKLESCLAFASILRHPGASVGWMKKSTTSLIDTFMTLAYDPNPVIAPFGAYFVAHLTWSPTIVSVEPPLSTDGPQQVLNGESDAHKSSEPNFAVPRFRPQPPVASDAVPCVSQSSLISTIEERFEDLFHEVFGEENDILPEDCRAQWLPGGKLAPGTFLRMERQLQLYSALLVHGSTSGQNANVQSATCGPSLDKTHPAVTANDGRIKAVNMQWICDVLILLTQHLYICFGLMGTYLCDEQHGGAETSGANQPGHQGFRPTPNPYTANDGGGGISPVRSVGSDEPGLPMNIPTNEGAVGNGSSSLEAVFTAAIQLLCTAIKILPPSANLIHSRKLCKIISLLYPDGDSFSESFGETNCGHLDSGPSGEDVLAPERLALAAFFAAVKLHHPLHDFAVTVVDRVPGILRSRSCSDGAILNFTVNALYSTILHPPSQPSLSKLRGVDHQQSQKRIRVALNEFYRSNSAMALRQTCALSASMSLNENFFNSFVLDQNSSASNAEAKNRLQPLAVSNDRPPWLFGKTSDRCISLESFAFLSKCNVLGSLNHGSSKALSHHRKSTNDEKRITAAPPAVSPDRRPYRNGMCTVGGINSEVTTDDTSITLKFLISDSVESLLSMLREIVDVCWQSLPPSQRQAAEVVCIRIIWSVMWPDTVDPLCRSLDIDQKIRIVSSALNILGHIYRRMSVLGGTVCDAESASLSLSDPANYPSSTPRASLTILNHLERWLLSGAAGNDIFDFTALREARKHRHGIATSPSTSVLSQVRQLKEILVVSERCSGIVGSSVSRG